MSDKKNRIEKTIIAVLSICCVICVIIIICNLDFYFPGLNTGDPSAVTVQENTTEYNPSVITDYPWKESTSGSSDTSSAAVGVSSGDVESGKTDNSGASGNPGTETGITIPEKTASPDTTAVFVSDTTSKPGQTDAAETTRKQNETLPTHTTSAPERTVRPETTTKPWQTIAPITTKRPEQTTSPVTTKRPQQTTSPVTTSKPKTSAPETTKTPTTTKTPETTKTPVTTKPVSPETTVEIPESYPVPDDITYGVDVKDILIAPNGDEVSGTWVNTGNKITFVVDIPELEMFTPYEWWGWNSNYNVLVWGYYVKTSWATVGFKPDVQLPPKQGPGPVDTEVHTIPPGTWW